MSSVTTDRRFGVNAGAAIKVPCVVATTAQTTLSGLQTIDGVTLAEGDRVLVKSQTSALENGIYIASSGTWTRSPDFDGSYDVVKGTLVSVVAGTTNQGYWYVTTANPISFGTSLIAFARSSSTLAVISAFVQTLLDDADSNTFLTTLTATRSETGAVPVTMLNKTRQIVSAIDFGVVADGGTDDGAALQAGVDAMANASVTGGMYWLPKGFIKTLSALNIVKGMMICGVGMGLGTGTGNAGGTVLRSSVAAGDVINISSAEAVVLRDFTIDAPTVTKSAGTTGVRIQGAGGSGNINNRSRLENLRILNMYDAVYWDSASNCVIDRCHIQDYLNIGVYSKQTGATDSGHNTITNSVIWDLNVGTSQACIRYDKGGDIRIIANKLLGSQYGVRVALDNGETGTMLILGTSFEEQKVNCIRIEQAVVQKNFGNVTIQGCELSIIVPTPQNSIAVVAGTPGGGATCWVKNISITGNVINNAHNAAYAAISVQDGEGVVVAANTISSGNQANPTGIDMGGNVVSGKIAGNVIFDTPGGNYSDSAIKFKVPTAVIRWSTGTATVAAATTTYLGAADANATEGLSQFYIPYKCKILNLQTHASTSPTGSDSYTYTVRVNGADTTLTCSVTGGNTDGQDRTHVASVPSPAGPSTAARVSLKLVTSATAAAAVHTVTMQVTEDD